MRLDQLLKVITDKEGVRFVFVVCLMESVRKGSSTTRPPVVVIGWKHPTVTNVAGKVSRKLEISCTEASPENCRGLEYSRGSLGSLKVTTIEEANDITTMKFDELSRFLRTFELTLEDREPKKKSGIALQVINEDTPQLSKERTQDDNLVESQLNKEFNSSGISRSSSFSSYATHKHKDIDKSDRTSTSLRSNRSFRCHECEDKDSSSDSDAEEYDRTLISCTTEKDNDIKNLLCNLLRSDEADLWHKRLGHIKCPTGKQVKASHNSIGQCTISRVLKLLHMDLMDPMQVESLGGKKYAFLIVDNFSRYTLAPTRNKARLVTQGYAHIEGADFCKTFAPVTCLEAIRLLLRLACIREVKLYQMDVKSALLNDFLNEEVYVA
ncbi:Retrovirus-related Pol polyprotein from transposon TNT 1-94 [Cucumis melo var. makuwa]|uniref:Retrovirus-related Pol polyprotein from transposon TNT 1-94 n=1 Tax=Cucumis melo var. makuwa TaxID=1194695 RepID=A0A5D3C1S5_CUCMM|nr:Retrovirus-related Pol polyprotein from transposon TNT 1-94 [Cucumis melo var. makuwa]TYK05310.1 Retrovirus-related Pol polyprotein from transposon TNT 1-94 [Cucumis melo var. makuwa]